MKTEISTELKANPSTDLVLQEIWHIKDTLSATYDHDVRRLFANTREHENHSGHTLVKLSDLRKPSATA
jgi:hypothetical protein